MLMYAATVFIILLSGEPALLQDDHGPYKTMKECRARAGDMFNFAMENFSTKAKSIKAGCKETWVGPREERT